MIKFYGKQKDTEDTLWSVFTSFGYKQIGNISCKEIEEEGKFCWFDGEKATALTFGEMTDKAYAEACALCIEASLANGLEDFEVIVSNPAVYELLELFGFEKMIKLDEKCEVGFKALCGEIQFAKGCCHEKKCCCKFNIPEFMKALAKNGVDMSEDDVSSSLIFAEKDAEGLAYDVAYNLRVNGCIIEYYNGTGDVEKAVSYAKSKGITCVLRTYADGKLFINDFVKNEIIETNVDEFLGYYDDEEECCCHDHDGECDCGHHH